LSEIAPNFASFWPLKFFEQGPQNLSTTRDNATPTTDHAAKFCSDRQRELRDFASKKDIRSKT